MEITSQYLADILFNEVVLIDEYGLRDILKDKRRNIKAVIDIGANFGITSMMAKFLFPEAKVIAIEPIPETFQALERNTRHLNIITLNKAFSDGRSLFLQRAPNHLINPGMNKCTEDKDHSDKEEILGTNLAQIFNTYQIDKNEEYIIKIDCEGGEKYLLEDGNLQYIDNAICIAGEFHFNRYLSDWPTKEKCMEMLAFIKRNHDISKTKLFDITALFCAKRYDII